MTSPWRWPVPGVPGLVVVDVRSPYAEAADVRALQEVHARHFPDYPHVADEIEHDAREGSSDPGVVMHQLLLELDGQPVGVFLVHTQLRRGIALRHFLAIDQQARAGLPFGWLRPLGDLVVDLAEADVAAAAGTGAGAGGAEAWPPLLATASEISPQHLDGWVRLGYRTFDVGYAEPVHGKHWADHGAPQWHPLLPLVRLTPAGAERPFAQVALAAMEAFLLDFYRLPADDPVVAGILARTAALPG